ncbi:unnamed protein product, partial [Ectocarpus sp. 8 AP-2014]
NTFRIFTSEEVAATSYQRLLFSRGPFFALLFLTSSFQAHTSSTSLLLLLEGEDKSSANHPAASQLVLTPFFLCRRGERLPDSRISVPQITTASCSSLDEQRFWSWWQQPRLSHPTTLA